MKNFLIVSFLLSVYGCSTQINEDFFKRPNHFESYGPSPEVEEMMDGVIPFSPPSVLPEIEDKEEFKSWWG